MHQLAVGGRCNGSTIIIQREVSVGSDMWRPLANGRTLYCIKPGAPLGTAPGLYKEDIYEYEHTKEHPNEKSSCACASDVRGYGLQSYPYAFCGGNHYNENSLYNGEPMYDVAFIVSFVEDSHVPAYGDWADAVQQAVWMSRICMTKDPERGHDRATGLAIMALATNYHSFYTKIKANDTRIVKGNTTDYTKLQVDTEYNDWDNQKEATGYYRMGPFSIDYVSGVYDGYSFGGISDMYMYDDSGRKYEITHFIFPDADVNSNGAGRYVTPRYFSVREPINGNFPETGPTNYNLIDFYHFAYGKEVGYPEPNQEFYVEVRASDLDSSDKKSLKLHADFQYLKCKMEICIRYKVIRYKVNQTHRHHSPHTHGPGGGTCHTCTKTAYISQEQQQELVYVPYAGRELIPDSIDIPLGGGGNDDGDDWYKDDKWPTTTMKIGGFVFEDYTQGKEQEVNSIKDDNDIVLKNIKVTLWEVDKDGNKTLANLATYKQEFPRSDKEETNDDYTRRINPTLTDEKGYYEFRGVDKNKKYIVEFTYNGQEYMPTQYLTYNGNQISEDVKSMVKHEEEDNYNSVKDEDIWRTSSKGTELTADRNTLTTRFAEIGSSPKNYKTKNNLNYSDKMYYEGGGIYNKTYNERDLKGLVIREDGKSYEQVYTYAGNNSLIDYLIITGANGQKQVTFVEGAISQKIREFIEKNRRYPTDEEMINTVYQEIINGTSDPDVKNKLQFIEDCKISAWTKNQVADTLENYDQYPVYNRFKTYVKEGNRYPNNSYADGSYDGTVTEYASVQLPKAQALGGYELETYKNVYPGQLQINLGLWERQEADLSIKKDAYKVAMKINGKMEIYDYDKRNIGNNDGQGETPKNVYDEFGNRIENTTWDISVRLSDGAYYGDNAKHYKGDLYDKDYHYRIRSYGSDADEVEQAKIVNTGEKTSELEVYLTYKIAVRNQSLSTIVKVEELIDHYDKDLEYMPGLSWAMYKNSSEDANSVMKVSDNDYYLAIKDYANKTNEYLENADTQSETSENAYLKVNENAKGATVKDGYGAWYNSKYGKNDKVTQQSEFNKRGYATDGSENGKNAVYIRGLSNKQLASGETAYVYLTFKVKKDPSKDNAIITDEIEGKQNIVEINGYSTYYKDGTKLPNYGIKNHTDIAGLIDVDSNPGNLDASKLPSDGEKFERKHERYFEDDTDHAPDVRILVSPEDQDRTLEGYVVEDERTKAVQTALVGDGNLENELDKKGIKGVTVELVEIIPRKDDIPLEQIRCIGFADLPQHITSTDEKGHYLFKGYIPGNYIVRFRYGDTKATALSREQGGENDTAYNGQDYKSTTYQGGAPYGEDNGYAANRTSQYVYDFIKTDANIGWSDAKDMQEDNNGITKKDQDDTNAVWGANRKNVNSVAQTIKNHLGEVLASAYDTPGYRNAGDTDPSLYNQSDMDRLHEELIKNAQMRAETGLMNIEIEYNRNNSYSENLDNNTEKDNYGFAHSEDKKVENTGNTSFDWLGGILDWLGGNKDSGDNEGTEEAPADESKENYENGKYHVKNVNLGLEERPKAQLELEKKVENVKITAINGDTIFDSTKEAPGDNMLWVEKEELATDLKELYGNKKQNAHYYPTYYNNNYAEDSHGKGDNKSDITKYRTGKFKGIIQPSLDEEVMQGATIKVAYKIAVRNIGETDYTGNKFYYAGVEDGEIVTTSLDKLLDYVSNNFQFDTNAEYQGQTNTGAYGWNIVEDNELIKANAVNETAKENFVNAKLDHRLKEYNNQVWTEKLKLALKPEAAQSGNTSNEIKLILSEMMSPNNATDDLTYTNIAEIVQTSNTVGRRMAYSVAGNQDANYDPEEIDASRAEEIKVTIPYGEKHIFYILIAVVLIIITVGIILIRKYVIIRK